MALFARALAPHGVAFVSYNALPARGCGRCCASRPAPRRREDLASGSAGAGAELFGFLAPWSENAAGRLRGGTRVGARAAAAAPAACSPRRPGRALRAGLAARRRRAPRAHGLRYLGDAEPAELLADRQPPGVDASSTRSRAATGRVGAVRRRARGPGVPADAPAAGPTRRSTTRSTRRGCSAVVPRDRGRRIRAAPGEDGGGNGASGLPREPRA